MSDSKTEAPLKRPPSQWKSLFWGGLLPIVAFTVIEEWQGPVWGTVAGLVFGAGEIIYEYRTQRKVSSITLGSNFLIFVLGFISIWTQEGFWFKMQPALLTLAFAGWIITTSLTGKPMLPELLKKQSPNPLPEPLVEFLGGLNFRLGLFFVALAGLSAWAALHWSTEMWALLKGVGSPVLILAYMILELIVYRLKINRGPKSPR